jgi:hypothetical protein
MPEVFDPMVKELMEQCPQNPEGNGHTLVHTGDEPDGVWYMCKYGCGVAASRIGKRLPVPASPGSPESPSIP